jgi:hypothetical protein
MLERRHVLHEQVQRLVLRRLIRGQCHCGLGDRFRRVVTLVQRMLYRLFSGRVPTHQVGRGHAQVLLYNHTVLVPWSVRRERLRAIRVDERGARVQPGAHVLTDGEPLKRF